MLSRRVLGWLRHLRDNGFDSSNGFLQSNGISVPVIMGEPILFPMLVLLAVVWLLPHTPLPSRLYSTLSSTYHSIPSVKVDYPSSKPIASLYPRNKTALYLEPRSLPYMTPLLLHMLTVIPPSWSVLFLGSTKTVQILRDSYTAARYEELGKLRVLDLEGGEGVKWSQAWGRRWDDLSIDEMGNRLLTNLSFYEEELRDVNWLLVWHSDAILCANAERDLEDWVGWDWVGAPWVGGGRFGGNGGLSMRNVEKVKEILRFQKRADNSAPEDQWLSARLGLLPGAKMCPPDKEKEFAVEDVWHEWPMGYHVNPAGLGVDVWALKMKRKQIFEYCPEIKMILDMRLERERCNELPPEVPAMPDIQIDYSLLAPDSPNPANVGKIPGIGMSKEQYGNQFGQGEKDDSQLKDQIKELEAAMAELKKGDQNKSSDESKSAEGEASEPTAIIQEVGEPVIADNVHAEDVHTSSEEGEASTTQSELTP